MSRLLNYTEAALFNFIKTAYNLCKREKRPCNKFTCRFFKKEGQEALLFVRRVNPLIKVQENDRVVEVFHGKITDAFFESLKKLFQEESVMDGESWGYSYSYRIQGRVKSFSFLTDDREIVYVERAGSKDADYKLQFDMTRVPDKTRTHIKSYVESLGEKDHSVKETDSGIETYKRLKDNSRNLGIHIRVHEMSYKENVFSMQLEQLYEKAVKGLEETIEVT